MNKFFTNDNQLLEWVGAAENIRKDFGINKALGYLIGEKFYSIIKLIYCCQKLITSIEEQRKKPNYHPIQEEGVGENKSVINLDEIYEEQLKRIEIARDVLIEFANLTKKSFKQREIKKYFDSNPRFGLFGHTLSEKEHEFLVEKGAVEHSLETELEDAFIYGEMRNYLLSEPGHQL